MNCWSFRSSQNGLQEAKENIANCLLFRLERSVLDTATGFIIDTSVASIVVKLHCWALDEQKHFELKMNITDVIIIEVLRDTIQEW